MGLAALRNDPCWETLAAQWLSAVNRWPFILWNGLGVLILENKPLFLNLCFLGYHFSIAVVFRAVVLQSYRLSVEVPLALSDNSKFTNLPYPECQWVFHPLVLMLSLICPQLPCHPRNAFYASFLLLTSNYLPHLMGRYCYLILQRKKLGFREVYQLAWGHRTNKWPSQNLCSPLTDSVAYSFITTLCYVKNNFFPYCGKIHTE